MSTFYDEPYSKCQTQISKLKNYIQQKKANRDNKILCTIANEPDNKNILSQQIIPRFRLNHKLTGHFGKIYSLCWFPDTSNRVLSASQDGKLLVFDANTRNKILSIPLRSAWVMTCAVSPSTDHVASGGLCNQVSLYETKNYHILKKRDPVHEFMGHEGYVSSIKFIDSNRILSGSGDMTVKLWDIQKQKCIQTYTGSGGDIEAVDVNTDKSLFICGSIDAACYLHDYRVKASLKSVAKFNGHQSDINALRWFPDNMSFVSASDDSTIRLWDIRSFCTLNIYQDANIYCSVTSVDCSQSGRYIVSGYDDYPLCIVWDTLSGVRQQTLDHPTRVSCLQISPQGDAVMTGSWDKILREWTTKPEVRLSLFGNMNGCEICCLMCLCVCHGCFTCQCCK